MVIKLLGDKATRAYQSAEDLIRSMGHAVWDESYYYTDLAIAPLLTKKIPDNVLTEPRFGTLIFHPSPLPYGRGAASIKWAYKRCEPITAATWFWADSGLDTGDICEQEIIRIDPHMRPREFYEADVIPAMLRTLERALSSINTGYIRRVPQIDRYATYDRRV